MVRVKQTIQRSGQLVARYLSPALLATILAAIIVGLLLFVEPIHGLADNGDYYRAIFVNGLYKFKNYHMLSYVNPKLGIMQYYNETTAAVFSSQPLFVKAAVFLNKLFYSHHVFDLRFMGLVYYVPYLGGIYLLTEGLTHPYRKFRSYLIALLVVFIFADSSFTLYFNSFFAEPGMFVLTIYMFASILLLARHRYQHELWLIILYFVSVMLLIANKQQNAPLALSFVVVSLGLFSVIRHRAQWLWLGLGITGILVTGVLTYTLITKQFNDINKYQAFTHGVLMHTTDPSKKIKKQGISEQYALIQGQDYYPKNFTAIQPSSAYVQKHLNNQYSFMWIVEYYWHNPQQFQAQLDVVAEDMMITQVKAVGDYTQAAGKPAGAQVTYFTGFSTMAGAFFPQKFAFDLLLAVALALVFGVGAYQDLKRHRSAGVLRFFLVIGLLTIFIFVPIISIIGDGDADLAKHLFMVPMSLDLILVMFIADILNHRLWDTAGEIGKDRGQ
ncbi:hypothetical protein [Lactiplantibacillus herbarum]|uniref:glycan biosynthesis hexose transferase WsfD n=1 Tax=Lactiplantibacillus herbarum TaxID=1670446 RepID=UPI00064F6314|nr:hypothetical protein [Lactiplantibacillus herbarum]